MKNNILIILALFLSSISQAAYIATIPLEQSNGGNLPNNSIIIGVGGSNGGNGNGEEGGSNGGNGNENGETGGSNPTIDCNFAGYRTDGVPNYGGYSYHHIEYWGSYSTVWDKNQYIGSLTDEQLAERHYSRGALITVGSSGQNYYELCIETVDTN